MALALMTTLAYAGNFDVNTGFGYIKDSEGNIIAKYDLPKGEHKRVEGYTYHEVANRNALNNVIIYQAPETEEQKREKLIQEKMRSLAIAELIKESKITE